jgi:hypothetical protein
MRRLSSTPPASNFVGSTNSDLAFLGNYAIQGNYNGYMIWDISTPVSPSLVSAYLCPASQSDVSVYGNLLFVSGEGLSARLDCGTQGVNGSVSGERLRGVRIFDISDIRNPRNVGNVQTCRGSHTHSVLVPPGDPENIYLYISGSSGVRPEEELQGCSALSPSLDPNSALFRIEVIQVPLSNPGAARIVSSPRIFDNLAAPPQHGLTPVEREQLNMALAAGAFVGEFQGQIVQFTDQYVKVAIDSVVAARGGRGAPLAQDSAAFRNSIPAFLAAQTALLNAEGPQAGPSQCHDITLYPEIGMAGGACAGYGMLLDIRDPINPRRLTEVADSNFSYWHSATFSNDGRKVLFTDEWGGGGAPKCRETDPREWGGNAIFTINNNQLEFQSYYKLPAPQTEAENCVAHNGSLIPIPGRDVMVQAWYQGGISIFEWTDPKNPVEIAYHDRGPVDAAGRRMGGPWSVYWYNGLIVSSEIARGLDIFELTPSGWLSRNEIDAAKSVHWDYLNPQGQSMFVFPPTFALSRAYVDQLERSGSLSASRIASVRQELANAESASGSTRSSLLTRLAGQVDGEAGSSGDATKVHTLAASIRDLAAVR